MIGTHVVQFHEHHFNDHDFCSSLESCHFDNVIPTFVIMEENELLTKVPLEYEVRKVVITLNADRPPGLDGMSGISYQSYWNNLWYR